MVVAVTVFIPNFAARQLRFGFVMKVGKIHSCAELIDYVNQIGFLPLLKMGVAGWSASEAVAEECQYKRLPRGGWEWLLWKWKGSVVRESGCAYGKFFLGKAGFVSREWWPDFCNCLRSRFPAPEEGSVEEIILLTLRESGKMVSRELRTACGFTGPKMRGRFDTYISRLEAAGHVVTEDFVYSCDRYGREYGWGLSLLTTPEALFGRPACHPGRSPEESRARMLRHFERIFPGMGEGVLDILLRTK